MNLIEEKINFNKKLETMICIKKFLKLRKMNVYQKLKNQFEKVILEKTQINYQIWIQDGWIYDELPACKKFKTTGNKK